MNEMEQEVLRVLVDSGITVNTEGDDIEILEYDSLMFIAAVVELEQRFNVEIPTEYLNEEFFGTFQNVIDVLDKLTVTYAEV